VVVNLDRSPQQVVIADLDGSSYANSLQAELNVRPLEHLDMRLAYRYLDVRQSVDGALRERPFVARHRAFLNLGYATGEADGGARMLYDLTLQWFGAKRLPDTWSNPEPLQRPAASPSFALLNLQVTRSFAPFLDVYAGVENLLDFRQPDPILDPENPQGPYFDTSLVWGPVAGRMVYLGLRWTMGG
jgi:outer membrane receptor protein involved in Fe transport